MIGWVIVTIGLAAALLALAIEGRYRWDDNRNQRSHATINRTRLEQEDYRI